MPANYAPHAADASDRWVLRSASASGHLDNSLVGQFEPLPACRAGEQERPDLHGLEVGGVVGHTT
jgi:hypothetical protein